MGPFLDMPFNSIVFEIFESLQSLPTFILFDALGRRVGFVTKDGFVDLDVLAILRFSIEK